ncbi:MAG: MATE family efflux transporter [Peptoniphilaceae bacterium]|nr:MATE family efflux transporter [Peptoniphilaceae bacterium]MDD7383210.1 MATE family efflux transporter [Peptoniphilaceae bacterium]MDY3738434.1 MATE family efflux transporter [Peptoniphilaceae bacterium]
MKSQPDLLEGSIPKNLLKMSLPLTATAFVTMAYNLTDTIWIGRIGTNAVAAAGTIGFLIWIAGAISFIPKIGMGVLASQYFGAGDIKKTQEILESGFTLTIIISLINFILMFLIKDIFIGFYKFDYEVAKSANDYFLGICLTFILTLTNTVLSQAFYSLGDSLTPFKISSIGLIFNVIVDPFLIFGIGPFPEFGIFGAGLATVLGELIVLFVFIFVINKRNDVLKLAFEFKYRKTYWYKNIISLGIFSSAISAFQAIVAVILNRFMAYFGPVPVAVYTIGSQIEQICWMTVEGLQSSISAFTAQNFGAKNFYRVKEVIKYSLFFSISVGVVAFLILFIFRNDLFLIFVPNDVKTQNLGAKYLMIMSISEIFIAMELGITGIFNGLGDTKTPSLVANFLNLLRIPMALIFMKFFGGLGVWISMSLSSILKGSLDFLLLHIKMKKQKILKMQ